MRSSLPGTFYQRAVSTRSHLTVGPVHSSAAAAAAMAKSGGGDYFRRTSLFWMLFVILGAGHFTVSSDELTANNKSDQRQDKVRLVVTSSSDEVVNVSRRSQRNLTHGWICLYYSLILNNASNKARFAPETAACSFAAIAFVLLILSVSGVINCQCADLLHHRPFK